MIRWSGWYRVVLVRWICLWAPGGCSLLPTLSACLVPCIPWRTTTYMIGGECWDLHLLMLCRFPYDSITNSYCTWIVVLWPLVRQHRLMWPLAECISSVLMRTPSLQLGVLQSLQGSFHLRPILLSHLTLLHPWWNPGSWSTKVRHHPSNRPKLGIREWIPLHLALYAQRRHDAFIHVVRGDLNSVSNGS